MALGQAAGDVKVKRPIDLQAEKIVLRPLDGGGNQEAAFAATDFEFDGAIVAEDSNPIQWCGGRVF
jgi:hypothetical protein